MDPPRPVQKENYIYLHDLLPVPDPKLPPTDQYWVHHLYAGVQSAFVVFPLTLPLFVSPVLSALESTTIISQYQSVSVPL